MTKPLSPETQKRVNDLLAAINTKDVAKCSGTITGWKGWFTREINDLNKEIALAADTAPSKDMMKRLFDAHLTVEIRYHALTSGLEYLVKIDPGNVEKYTDDVNTVYEKFMDADRDAFRTMNNINSELEQAAAQAKAAEEKATRPSTQQPQSTILRVSQDLKPSVLYASMSPMLFNDWIQKFGTYLRSNGVMTHSINEQVRFANQYIDPDLWMKIESHINVELQTVRFNEIGKVLVNSNEEDKDNWNLIDVLADEFRRIYPLRTRRLETLKFKQKNSQGTLAMIAEFKKRSIAADLDNMSSDELKLCIVANAMTKEDTRLEALKSMDKGETETIEDLERLVQSLEIAERTSEYVNTGKNANDNAFKMTSYQKSKREARSPSRSKNDGQGYGRGRGRGQGGRGGHSGRGRGRGFGRRGQSQQRYQSPSPQRSHKKDFRGRSKSRGTYCHLHKSKFHSDSQCREQRSSSSSPKQNTANFTNYCMAVRRGEKGGKQTPRVAFDFKIPLKNGKGEKTFRILCIPDTGSTRTLLPLKVARRLGLTIKPAKNETLRNASGKFMKVNGKCLVKMSLPNSDEELLVDCIISEDLPETIILISWHDLEAFGLVKLEHTVTETCNVTEDKASKSKPPDDDEFDLQAAVQTLLSNFPDVLREDLPQNPIKMDPVKIVIDPKKLKKYKPTKCLTARQRPLAMEDACHEEVLQLVKDGKIRPLGPNEPTMFLHPGFFVMKNNKKPRLLTDLTGLNLVLERPVYPFLSTKDLLKKVNPEGRWFAKLDFLKGFFQVALDKASQLLTAFILPEGRFAYTAVPMGCSLSSDVFIQISDMLLSGLGLEGHILKLVDDLLVMAPTKAILIERVTAVLQRCREYGVALSSKKFECGSEVSFAGHRISANGIYVGEDKVAAIKSFQLPSSISDLRSYLGVCQSFAKFFPDLAQISDPLRQLLKKDVKFEFTPELIKAFEASKAYLTSSPILQPFRRDRTTQIYCDASLLGVGYMCCQTGQDGRTYLICCGSRALKPNERNSWSVTDLELEAIRWALFQCSYYTRGLDRDMLEILTDHKALPTLFKTKLSEMKSPRQLRLRYDLQGFNFRCTYFPGKFNFCADKLSRSPLWSDKSDIIDDQDEDFLTSNIARLVVSDTNAPMYLEQLRQAAEEDKDYQSLVIALKSHKNIEELEKGHPAYAYQNVWNDLSIDLGLVVYNSTRIVVPKGMRPEILRLLHLSHAGLSKTRKLAQQYFFWPQLNSQIQSMINSCEKCNTFKASNPVQVVKPIDSEASAYPMSHLCLDLFSYENKDYLSLVDRFSGFSWCYQLRSTTSTAIIKVLDMIFLEQGLPAFIQLDNGPNIDSSEFKNHCANYSIKLIYDSPYNKRAAGMAERYCGIHKALLKKSDNFQDFLLRLREHRNTPRSDCDQSPAQLFLSREQRTLVPRLPSVLKKIVSDPNVYLQRIKKSAKKYLARPGKILKKLAIGQKVQVQNPVSMLWDSQGKILEQVERCPDENCDKCQPHSPSYLVSIKGKKKIRNLRFLRKYFEKTILDKDSDVDTAIQDKSDKNSDENSHEQNVIRPCIKNHRQKHDEIEGLPSKPRRSPRLRRVSWAAPLESVRKV